MRISDWSSDVCSSDLVLGLAADLHDLSGAVQIEAAGHVAADERARAVIEVLRHAPHIADHGQVGRGRCRKAVALDEIVAGATGQVAVRKGEAFHFRLGGEVAQAWKSTSHNSRQ